MAIQAYPSHIKAENNLKALEALRQTPVEELWNKSRVLPTTPLYLLASRYFAQERSGWPLTSKWDMFKFLDKALKQCINQQSLDKITRSMDGAIVDQRKIVLLKTAYSVLSDGSKTSRDKTNAYLSIKNKDPAFFEDIKNAIWVAHGKDPKAGLDFADKKIENEPNGPIQTAVIKKMAATLKEGYSDYSPEFFKNIKAEIKV